MTGPTGTDDLAQLILGDDSVTDLLQAIVQVAAGVLPDVAGASVTLARQGEEAYETSNASSDRIRRVDEMQYEAGSGPCIEAILGGAEVKAAIPSDAWPHFSAAADQASIRAVWSLPLAVRDRPTGALNLYSSATAPWDGGSGEPARLLARQASAVLLSGMALARSEHANLTIRRALETRTVIGQA